MPPCRCYFYSRSICRRCGHRRAFQSYDSAGRDSALLGEYSKTGVRAKKLDHSTVGLPKLGMDLAPGAYKYKATIAGGGQQIPLTISTTIQEENGAWSVVDKTESPMGEGFDRATLDKATLVML